MVRGSRSDRAAFGVGLERRAVSRLSVASLAVDDNNTVSWRLASRLNPRTLRLVGNSMDASLPDFEDPPVTEVALAVQFEPLSALRTPQIGLIWNKFREQFPRIEEHAPLGRMVERFGVVGPPKPEIRLEMTRKPPVPRCWFLNESGTELIQVQQDRFAHNWRKVGEGDEYPRYEHVRACFRNELVKFGDFVRQEKLGDLEPDHCEVTYVNHIVSGRGWDNHGQIGEVLTVLAPEYSEPFLPDAEEFRLRAAYVVPGSDGTPLGRLHVSVDPAYRRSDARPMFVLNLVARARPEGQDLDSVLRVLDIGREWIVRGFAAITTGQMHKIWGRKR